MKMLHYNVFDDFTGQFTVSFKNNPFKYRVCKLNKTLYRIKIYLTDNYNKIGSALIKNDSSRSNAVVSINLHRQVNCASLTDLKLQDAIKGLTDVSKLNLDSIIHKGSKLGAIHVMKNHLRFEKNYLYSVELDIKNTKKKLENLKNNN